MFLLPSTTIAGNSSAYLPEDIDNLINNSECLKCNLTGADLKYYSDKKNLNDKIIDSSYFSYAQIGGISFNNLKMNNSNFVKVRASNLNLNDSTIDSCNFSHSDFIARFNSSIISNSDFSNSSSDEIVFYKSELKNVSFNNSALSKSDFSKSTLSQVTFKNAIIKKGLFSKTNFNDVNISEAVFDYSNFFASNMTLERLKDAKSFKCVILNDGTIYTNNGLYDCSRLNLIRKSK